jgi:hypothetical protein
MRDIRTNILQWYKGDDTQFCENHSHILKLKWIGTEHTSHLFPFKEGISLKVTNEQHVGNKYW